MHCPVQFDKVKDKKPICLLSVCLMDYHHDANEACFSFFKLSLSPLW
jgi:hypothetical protein